MKRSEVMRTMRTIMEGVSEHDIEMRHYRSFRNYYGAAIEVPFKNQEQCGTLGCVLGWSAASKELAPVDSDYDTCELNWTRYTRRILGLNPGEQWQNINFFRWLFARDRYLEVTNHKGLKAEIIYRLKAAEQALIRCDEDVERAYDDRYITDLCEGLRHFNETAL